MRERPLALGTQNRSHYVLIMSAAPTHFDLESPEASHALIRRNPDKESEIEMFGAIWGSAPRFAGGINIASFARRPRLSKAPL